MALIVFITKMRPGERDAAAEPEGRKLVALFIAVAVGVLPEVLLGRPIDATGFPSRLRMPALAFGAVFVTGLVSQGVIPRWRTAAFGALAFLAGYQTVVDLAQFFDRVHHQRLLDRIGQRVADRRVIELVRLMLKAAVVMPDGTRTIVREGTPQGGPLAP